MAGDTATSLRELAQCAGVHELFHVTRCTSLPDIGASGGLLPANLRRRTVPHNWGAAHREFRPYLVCCSFAPSFGMMRRLAGEELALLILNANAVLSTSDVLPSPGNSGSPRMQPYLAGEVDQRQAFEQCLRSRGSAELLVRGPVPLPTVRTVVFSDVMAQLRWWRPFVEACDGGLRAGARSRGHGRSDSRWFPEGLAVTKRGPVTEGADQRLPSCLVRPTDSEAYEEQDTDRALFTADAKASSWLDFYDDQALDGSPWAHGRDDVSEDPGFL